LDERETGRGPFCEGKERMEREDVEATDSVRLRTSGWGVETLEEGAVSEGGRLLALPTLATDPLHEEELEDVDIREARRQRAAAVI
jgi:hypothetical protein